ncbi:MAG: hypothetical protein HY795_06320 [Desulfovibrio sp.]|nr:hypothetical protein [Desulfovibrio sp.]MBI4961286.1 hypothetical protein [Desulfovibrio sp.]
MTAGTFYEHPCICNDTPIFLAQYEQAVGALHTGVLRGGAADVPGESQKVMNVW